VFLSIIACTHNRSRDVIEYLRALRDQVYCMKDVEVVVVNNASTDDTVERVNYFIREAQAREAQPSVVYVEEPAIGSSNARNLGARTARGWVIAYIDDDEVPGPGGWNDYEIALGEKK